MLEVSFLYVKETSTFFSFKQENVLYVLGSKVVKLQEDGLFSTSSYLQYRGGLPRNLKDFTLCARLNLNFLRGEKNFWLNIGNSSHQSLLAGSKKSYTKRQGKLCTFDVPFAAFEEDEFLGPMVVVRRYHSDIEDSAAILLENFDFETWHHYCFTFSSYPEFPFAGGNVNLTNKAYMDGSLKTNGRRSERDIHYAEFKLNHRRLIVL